MINKKVIIAGLLASVVMGVIEMMYEGLFGQGFWSPVVYIAAAVLRQYQTVSAPVPFHIVPVIIGLIGHMMNSVILGTIFALIVINTRLKLGRAILGIMFGIFVFVAMWFVVLPFVDPVMLKLNPYVFAFSHFAWGYTIELMVKKRKN